MQTEIGTSDEINVVELISTLWLGKWIIGAVSLSLTVIAAIIVIQLPNIYRAEALLAPRELQQTSGIGQLAAQYGGLASLAGFNLQDPRDNVALALEVLQSRQFISRFIERHGILVPLMASKGWDRGSEELILDMDVYDPDIKEWTRDVDPPKTPKPSMQEAYEEFSEILSVVQDEETGFVTVSIEHYSPVVAKIWVDWLIEDLNSTFMGRDVSEAEHAIDYLNSQIEATSLAGLHAVFFRLIEEQIKTVILAKMSPEYLLRTIDPPIVPEQEARPNRLLIIVLVGVLSAMLASVGYLLGRRAGRTSTRSR